MREPAAGRCPARQRPRFVDPAPPNRIGFQKLIRESVMEKKAKLSTFHAAIQVTRLETWCVDAETPEQARALLEAGQGSRCHVGDCVFVEVERLLDEA